MPCCRRVFNPYFFPYSIQSHAIKGVFSIFALILTKALPKTGVYLNFCAYSNQSYSYFALTITKALPKRVFLLFCSYPNQSPTKKRVFLNFFRLILTKALPQKSVLYPYQKRCFSLFLPLYQPKSYQKECFFSISTFF